MGTGNGTGNHRLGEEEVPPLEVSVCALGRGARLERTIVEEPQHGLQLGEVSAAHWDNEAGMEKLAEELLYLLEHVG